MPTFTQAEWDSLIAAYPLGTVVSGEVVHRAMFGVYVQLDQLPKVPALLEIIHFGILAADPQYRIKFPDDYPALGTRIEAWVLAWSLRPKDMRLTQLQNPYWAIVTAGTQGTQDQALQPTPGARSVPGVHSPPSPRRC